MGGGPDLAACEECARRLTVGLGTRGALAEWPFALHLSGPFLIRDERTLAP